MTLLVKVVGLDRTIDAGKPCAIMCAEVVRPENDTRARLSENEFVSVHRSELPEEYVPLGPLDLTEFPHGGTPSFSVQHFSVSASLTGPVLFFFLFYDEHFDGSPFLGKVYSVKGHLQLRPRPLFDGRRG
jgi:hypothetical protein